MQKKRYYYNSVFIFLHMSQAQQKLNVLKSKLSAFSKEASNEIKEVISSEEITKNLNQEDLEILNLEFDKRSHLLNVELQAEVQKLDEIFNGFDNNESKRKKYSQIKKAFHDRSLNFKDQFLAIIQNAVTARSEARNFLKAQKTECLKHFNIFSKLEFELFKKRNQEQSFYEALSPFSKIDFQLLKKEEERLKLNMKALIEKFQHTAYSDPRIKNEMMIEFNLLRDELNELNENIKSLQHELLVISEDRKTNQLRKTEDLIITNTRRRVNNLISEMKIEFENKIDGIVYQELRLLEKNIQKLKKYIKKFLQAMI